MRQIQDKVKKSKENCLKFCISLRRGQFVKSLETQNDTVQNKKIRIFSNWLLNEKEVNDC